MKDNKGKLVLKSYFLLFVCSYLRSQSQRARLEEEHDFPTILRRSNYKFYASTELNVHSCGQGGEREDQTELQEHDYLRDLC